VGSKNPKEEVAFVFYMHRESQGRLEMVLGGFMAKFTLPSAKKEADILRTDLVATTEVTPLPVETLARRFERSVKK